MKVRDIIKLLERDGWYLKKNVEVTVSSNILLKPGALRYRGIQMTIFLQAL
jgi:hypothetical protein